jgi:hypothetical protein
MVMPEESNEPIAEGLDRASTKFREFAAECMELAQKSHSLEQRMVYLKMASTWHQTAVRWEKDLRRRKWVQRGRSA